MGHFFEALKAGARVFKEGPDPSGYAVAGRPVRCPHCGTQKFTQGTALLNSRARTAFNVDWTDPSATLLVCAECGRIEWFASTPEVMPPD